MRYSPPRLACVALAVMSTLVGSGACSGDREGGGRAGDAAGPPPGPTVRDSAGVEIVENEGAPVEPVWTVSAEPRVTIGSLTGDGAQAFAWVTDASRLPDGGVVVLDNELGELRAFGSDGSHRWTVGGDGEGPGEFTYAVGFVRLAGDTLLVDAGSKLIRYAADGTYIDEQAVEQGGTFAGSGLRGCWPWKLLPDGSFLLCPAETPPGTPSTLLRVSSDLERRDTLGDHDSPAPRHPLGGSYFVAAGGEPLRVGIMHRPGYEIEVWTPDGELERLVRRLDGRRPPTSEERSVAQAVVESRADEPGFEAPPPEAPELVGAGYGLRMGRLGDLWVRREPFLAIHERSLYDVFDPEGRFRGAVSFEGEVWVSEIGRDYVVTVRRGPADVPFIEVFELDRGG